MRCPARKTWLVAIRSMVYSRTSPGGTRVARPVPSAYLARTMPSVTPIAPPHDQLAPRPVRHLVRARAQAAGQEVQLDPFQLDGQRGRERAEGQLARGPGLVGVGPRADDQPLAPAGRLGGGVPRERHEVVERAAHGHVERAPVV